MPRVHSSQRQKNKPFKTKKTKSEKSKHKTAKTKPIGKSSLKRQKMNKNQFIKDIKNKKDRQVQKLTSQNQYLDTNTKQIVSHKLKNISQLKIIVLVPGNKEANPSKILQKLYQLLHLDQNFTCKANLCSIPFENLHIEPSSKSFIKNNLLIISGKKNNQQNINILALNDLLKCADIVCPVLSCSSTNTERMNLDPHQQGKAFDQTGYLILNIIRSMGTPSTIGIVQDLQQHKVKHHDKIQRLFKRFISSELGENDKITYLKGDKDCNGYNKLLRQMDTTAISQQNWKSQRGYMLVQNVTIDEKTNNVTFHGSLKGNCVNSNQLIHITGYQDYAIQKIQIQNKIKTKKVLRQQQIQTQQNNIIQYAVCSQNLYPFSKTQQQSEDLLSALQGLKLQTIEKKQNMQQENDQDYESVQQQQSEDCDMDEYFGNKEQQKYKRVQMEMRKQDQLQFEDQVQYAAEQVLRQKFKDYQGLKNFKTDQWNHLQNLPDVYDRIYTFKNYQRTCKIIQQQNITKAFAYPGFQISVTVINFPIQSLNTSNPLILSFLMKHQHKMTQLHIKVRRNPYYADNQTKIQSNNQYLISMGFRRFITRPMFSRVVNGTEKTKYTKKIQQDYENYFYCSFYHYNYFPPASAQIFRVNQFNTSDYQLSPIMYGQLVKCDPLHIILQRIILTGYPYKINKRRATVRFMFFNPKDVKYFKPIQVRTKQGKKGRIQQSLGTHGYMKVLFNDKVHQNDTVCMNLYRRVYPEHDF